MKRNFFLAAVLTGIPLAARADDWPCWLGPHGDLTWRESGLAQSFPKEGPKVLWRVPAANGYSGPAVSGDRVVLVDFVVKEGTVDDNPGGRTTIKGDQRVRCFNAQTGEPLWNHDTEQVLKLSFPNGPRCTPTIDDGKVYVLGAEGALSCLQLANGKPVWDIDLKKTYGVQSPIWGFSGHPLVRGNLLYCLPGGKGTTVVALDKLTGKEVWRALTAKEPGYAPPVLVKHGGVDQLLVWHSDAVASLNPLTGKEYWTVPFPATFNMAIMAPRVAGDYLFVGCIMKKSLLLKLKPDQSTPEIAWEGTPKQALGPKNATPIIDGDIMYGCDADGELRAVDLVSGERLWTSEAAVGGKSRNSGTVFMVKAGPQFVMFNDSGELILAELNRSGYREVARHKILDNTTPGMGGRKVVWSHPAFARQCVFARNDKELVCVSLAANAK